MATAAMKARATSGANGGAVVVSASVTMEFLVAQDNGGNYHWTLVDRNGNSLARSLSFASYEDAENAARVVLAGAGSARLERRVDAVSAVDIVARRDAAPPPDDTDSERWLDEGGSFSTRAARR